MSDVITGLKPELLWQYFAKICEIPHCSKNETAIMRWIAEEGKKHGAQVRTDSTGNVVLAVPATTGYENAPTTILQGHVDMVCEKRAGIDHDFANDPIRMRLDGEWMFATETTLGADNGIGVAAALAAMTDPDLVHGPLELLFTVDEETGLTGAMGLDPSLISGRVLINMDSEEDGMLYVGCAGGQHLSVKLPICFVDTPSDLTGMKVNVSGLMGGHSGCDIHENRGNAVKLVARTLDAIRHAAALADRANDVALSKITAGTAHNAIPRDGEAIIAIASDLGDWVRGVVSEVEMKFKLEFPNEANLSVTVEEAEKPSRVFDADSEVNATSMLMGFHNGVVAMSRDIPGLVETSNSLAVAQTKDDHLFALNSARSSNADAQDAIMDQNDAVAHLAGASTSRGDGYPGWNPDMDSPVLKLMTKLFEKRYEKTPIITAIHAGLECGLIGERFEGMDMVSFGPEIDNPHSPNEKVWIPSVERFWDLLSDTLKAIAQDELG